MIDPWATFILLCFWFSTDGYWSYQDVEVRAAQEAKKLNIDCVGILTDFFYADQSKSLIQKQAYICFKYFNKLCTHFVFLTQQMNIVNPENRPYLVMEGLVDKDFVCENKEHNMICMYTGSLKHEYGIDTLAEAFSYLEDTSLQLEIYGLEVKNEHLEEILKRSKNVRYCGYRTREEIVELQKEAFLLINPRPLEGEYTKYSFPSKTLEYMLSGTPVLTTKLAGIPEEYDDYLLYFDQTDPCSMANSIRNVLNKSELDRKEIGLKNQSFVLEKKNNVAQTKRILTMLVFK